MNVKSIKLTPKDVIAFVYNKSIALRHSCVLKKFHINEIRILTKEEITYPLMEAMEIEHILKCNFPRFLMNSEIVKISKAIANSFEYRKIVNSEAESRGMNMYSIICNGDKWEFLVKCRKGEPNSFPI